MQSASSILLHCAFAQIGSAQQGGPYKVLKTARVGGEGGWDYIYADADGRRLYIPREARLPRPWSTANYSYRNATIGSIWDLHANMYDPKNKRNHYGLCRELDSAFSALLADLAKLRAKTARPLVSLAPRVAPASETRATK